MDGSTGEPKNLENSISAFLSTRFSLTAFCWRWLCSGSPNYVKVVGYPWFCGTTVGFPSFPSPEYLRWSLYWRSSSKMCASFSDKSVLWCISCFWSRFDWSSVARSDWSSRRIFELPAPIKLLLAPSFSGGYKSFCWRIAGGRVSKQGNSSSEWR